jgi:hypothetical protein
MEDLFAWIDGHGVIAVVITLAIVLFLMLRK